MKVNKVIEPFRDIQMNDIHLEKGQALLNIWSEPKPLHA